MGRKIERMFTRLSDEPKPETSCLFKRKGTHAHSRIFRKYLTKSIREPLAQRKPLLTCISISISYSYTYSSKIEAGNWR